MRLKTKILAIGIVGLLAVAGLAVALTASHNVTAASDEAPVVTVDEQNATSDQNATSPVNKNMTVQVMGKIDCQRVPLMGVNVTVCTMNITREGNRTTIVVERVAEGITDADGKVNFSLPDGKYFIFAQYHGLRGFCHGNLSEDEMYTVIMHHWNWGHMKGQVFQCLDIEREHFQKENHECWT